MFNELNKNIIIDDKIKIIINPEIINKRRFHGSITQGIFSNLEYIINNNINFDYFLVLSSRTILTSSLNFEKIKKYMVVTKNIFKEFEKNNIQFIHSPAYADNIPEGKRTPKSYRICDPIDSLDGFSVYGYEKNYRGVRPNYKWYFRDPRIVQTNWLKNFKENFKLIVGGKHEGLCFTKSIVLKMYKFSINNNELMDEIYKTKLCVEEIIPQTLACSLSDDGDFYYTFIKEARKFGSGYNKWNNSIKMIDKFI